MKSILTICREVADLAAVKRPESLFKSASASDNIFLSVAQSALDSLMRYGDWPELVKEAIIEIIPQQHNYRLNSVCPDFYALLPNTIYIKDTAEKVIGAINPESWMKAKYFCDDNNIVKFKIQNNIINFLNLPDYPVKIVFQYHSSNICLEAKTFAEKSVLTADSDIPIFDNYLVKLAILWRWLKRSGLDYSDEYNEYVQEIKKKFSSSSAGDDICLSSYTMDNLSTGVKINVKVIH